MKKVFILSILFTIFISSSCSNPVYKKRKKCKGNGSWYGNRNLGLNEPKDINYYSFN